MSNGVDAATRRSSLHGMWSTRMAFILAVSGSAVGLGNIWKFPYIAGQNGGGAFVLVYLLCVFAVGLPVMMSEILIGRRGRRNPVATMQLLGEEEAGQSGWKLVGVVGVLAGVIILSFYSVFAGWSLAYIVGTATGEFVGGDPESVNNIFDHLKASWGISAFWHTAFMVMTVAVVARGVERGLERCVRLLMPALVILLLILLGYSISEGDFARGLMFLFKPDFDALTPSGFLIALGHAFFTLSVGMGAVMAYGAYLPEGTSIPNTSIAVVITDTAIALLAGMVIFPIVFANGLDPASGPGLIFRVLPLAFAQMTAGAFFGTLFFVLLTFAAWTSSIGLIEPAVAWLVEAKGLRRGTAAMLVGGGIWAAGFATLLSFNVTSDVQFWRGTLYTNIDHFTSNIMLPLGGFLITIFAGWVMCRNSSADELDVGVGISYKIWRFLARFVAPVAVMFIFFHATGVMDWLREMFA